MNKNDVIKTLDLLDFDLIKKAFLDLRKNMCALDTQFYYLVTVNEDNKKAVYNALFKFFNTMPEGAGERCLVDLIGVTLCKLEPSFNKEPDIAFVGFLEMLSKSLGFSYIGDSLNQLEL